MRTFYVFQNTADADEYCATLENDRSLLPDDTEWRFHLEFPDEKPPRGIDDGEASDVIEQGGVYRFRTSIPLKRE